MVQEKGKKFPFFFLFLGHFYGESFLSFHAHGPVFFFFFFFFPYSNRPISICFDARENDFRRSFGIGEREGELHPSCEWRETRASVMFLTTRNLNTRGRME